MLNNVNLQGRLTKDPEMRKLSSGLSYCSFILAVERNGKKEDGKQDTDFVPCMAWKNTADFIGKYFHKGDMAVLSGRFQSRNYEGQDGKNHVVYEICVSEMNFCGKKQADNADQNIDFG